VAPKPGKFRDKFRQRPEQNTGIFLARNKA